MKQKISYKNHSKIIEVDSKKFISKVRTNSKNELFHYLESKDFFNYLEPVKITNTEEIYPYIKEYELPLEDKAQELINIVTLLHIKTTTYQEIDLKVLDRIYNETLEKIEYLNKYYLDIQDFIETREFMAPAEYLLIINISNFYKALNYSKHYLNKWYQEQTKIKRTRYVQLHNNLTLDHFLLGEKPYLINWDKSKKDLVIYDFINFYHKNVHTLEMSSLFEHYQNKYLYTKEEMYLFKSLLSIPPKIIFTKSNISNVIKVREAVNYVSKTNIFLSKYNEKY